MFEYWIYVVATFIAIVIIKGIYDEIVIKVKSKKNDKRINAIRDSAYDEVLKKCKTLEMSGEVTYFSPEDVDRIVEDMKNLREIESRWDGEITMKKEKKTKKRSLWFLIWIPIVPVLDYLIMKWSIGVDMQQQIPEGTLGHPAPVFIIIGMALAYLVTCIILTYVVIRLIVFIILKIKDRKNEEKERGNYEE